jgi:hypothetical protein
MITILIIAAIITIGVFVWNKSNSAKPNKNVTPIEEPLPIIEEVVQPIIETTVVEKPKRATTKKPATQQASTKKTAIKSKKD